MSRIDSAETIVSRYDRFVSHINGITRLPIGVGRFGVVKPRTAYVGAAEYAVFTQNEDSPEHITFVILKREPGSRQAGCVLSTKNFEQFKETVFQVNLIKHEDRAMCQTI